MTTLMALKVEANHYPLLDFKIQIVSWQLGFIEETSRLVVALQLVQVK